MHQIKKENNKINKKIWFSFKQERNTDIHFRPLHTEKNMFAWVSVFGPTKKYINVAKDGIVPGQSLSHTIHSHMSR